jgi:hypothetical protein
VNVPVVMPELPPGIPAIGAYLQFAVMGATGTTLSSWGHLTLLDSSF